ncbi:hypothetical protein DSAG12_01557 [Promethearchaeum syntrophicum]|uniref:Uncharacterized protein n=1 Tax=Promethearchaeum syntrophicum TaxID=2594042 RepID=A0A5B9DAF6_9ARCH|nr:hypothetical protein [Candidatus Prometheoarchaeum syntrophicum]QEE15730.1 hypothetical protein DSAG12_01557 [Candidatus Prometheoarchaeum syntrophicum]
MKIKKTIKILLTLGIICLILGPLLGEMTESILIHNESSKIVNQESEKSFHDVDAYEISIKKNQKITIKFSVYSQNVTAYLKIFGKGLFDSEYIKNDTYGPKNVSGRYFLISKPAWSGDPSWFGETQMVVSCIQDDFYFIEFMGDGSSGGYIWNEPGDYVVFVYGSNSYNMSTEVTYNIEIYKDGPSTLLRNGFSTAGWAMLILAGLIIINYSIKKFRSG